MSPTKTTLFLLTQAVVWLWLTAAALGQTAPPKPLSGEEFSALLQARLKQVDDLHDLSDADREKLKDLYQQALGEMEAAKRWAAKAAQFEKDAAQAPLELQQTKAALASPAQPAPVVASDASVPQIEQAIAKREVELEQWRTTLAAVESELKGRANRRVEIPKQITQAKERLTKINNELQTLTTGDENSPASSARRMVLIAQRRTAEQEILGGDRELAVYETLTELLPLRRDLGVRRVALAEQVIKQLQELVNRRRQQEAEQQLQQASREAGQAHPTVLLRLIEENAALAETRKSLAARIVDATAQLEQVSRELSDVKELFKQVQEKAAVAEKTNATRTIGLFLRKKRDELPNVRTYRRNIAIRQQTMGEGELARLQLLDDRLALANVDLQTQAVLQSLNLRPQRGDRAELEKTVRQALKTKSDYLDALIADHDTYFKKLGALTDAEQQLIEATESCAQYIDQRVLWISSAAPLGSADLRRATDAFWWLMGPAAWFDIGRTLSLDSGRDWTRLLFSLPVSATFLLLFYWRRRFRIRMQQIGEKAARGSCYRFLPTLETTLLTALVAVGWPGLMYYLGWRLTAAAEASDLCRALGEGLIATARVFFALQLLLHTCGRQGLAESHFGWSAAALKLLRHDIRWFSLPALPLMCVAVTMAWQENDHWDTSLGRICFITALLFFALALQRILRPARVVFQAMVAARRGGWLDRFRYVWYPLCPLTPLALAVLAALGYHYGARQLVTRLILTAYALVGGIVCRALLLRWTLVSQRKLAIEQARQRRAAHVEGNGRRGNRRRRVADLGQRGARPGDDQHPDAPHDRILVGRGLRVGHVVRVDRRPAGPGQHQRHGLANHRERDRGATPARRQDAGAEHRRAAGNHAGRPGPGGHRSGHHDDRRQKSPRPAGNGRLAAPSLRRRRALRRGHRVALRDLSSRPAALLQHIGRKLVEGAMVRGRHELGARLRFAGNFCQLRLRPHYLARTAHPRPRRGYHRQHHRRGVANSHAGDHHHRPRPQGTDHSQQGVHHRPGAELDAYRPGQSGGDQRGHRLRLRHATSGRHPLESRPGPPQRARRPAAAGNAGLLW